MAQEHTLIRWSPADELKLLMGLSDNFSFDALFSILGIDIESIQLKCIAMDLYSANYDDCENPTELTLIPRPFLSVACVNKMNPICFKTLLELGWEEQLFNGEPHLKSPQWWISRPTINFQFNKSEQDELFQVPLYYLNQSKPWTKDEVALLLNTLQQSPSKTKLTTVMMRTMTSIAHHLAYIGLVEIPKPDDVGKDKIWIRNDITQRFLRRAKYYDVLPLLEAGWKPEENRLIAPGWWVKAITLDDIINNQSPSELSQSKVQLHTDILPTATDKQAARPAKWFAGNYRFLLKLLNEHHSIETIGKKMKRTPGAVRSRLQHMGIAQYKRGADNTGQVEIATQTQSEHFKTQPDYVKETLLNAGWVENESILIAPGWWVKYPHNLTT